MSRFGHPVEVTEQTQRIDQRQIPPELRTLPEDDADTRRQFSPLLHRIESCHAHRPSARYQDARQHFDRRALASSIWPDQADHLAMVHMQREVIHGMHSTNLRVHYAAQATQQTWPSTR